MNTMDEIEEVLEGVRELAREDALDRELDNLEMDFWLDYALWYERNRDEYDDQIAALSSLYPDEYPYK